MKAAGVQKIGIGVITCNREDMFRECIAGVPEADLVVVVNDGAAYAPTSYPSRIASVVQHRTNAGVGRSKNDALRFLMQQGCTDIFLCEDDIRITDPNLCHAYIAAGRTSGIKHLNFAYHGPRNKTDGGIPAPRKIVDYGEGITISLNRHIVGAFSYYAAEVLKECGYIDPVFRNVMEHIDHTNRIIRHGYHPPFWWFADLAESHRYIEDLDPDLRRTSIRSKQWYAPFSLRLQKLYFAVKNGHTTWNMPDTAEVEVERSLERLRIRHGSAIREAR